MFNLTILTTQTSAIYWPISQLDMTCPSGSLWSVRRRCRPICWQGSLERRLSTLITSYKSAGNVGLGQRLIKSGHFPRTKIALWYLCSKCKANYLLHFCVSRVIWVIGSGRVVVCRSWQKTLISNVELLIVITRTWMIVMMMMMMMIVPCTMIFFWRASAAISIST